MGKISKHVAEKGTSRQRNNMPKLSSHGTFRCKRKPNSKLCKNGAAQ